jgi:hypothetical protein
MLGSEIVTGLKIDCWLLPADRFPASALLSLSWIGLQHGCASLLLQDAALSYPTIGPLSRWVLPANRLPWEGYGNIACFKLTPFYHTLRQFVNHKVYIHVKGKIVQCTDRPSPTRMVPKPMAPAYRKGRIWYLSRRCVY